MASGLIVFAGRKGGGFEIIRDNETGFLIDPDREEDVELVVRKLKNIQNDPAMYSELIHNAREDAAKNFSMQKCASLKIDCYKERVENRL